MAEQAFIEEKVSPIRRIAGSTALRWRTDAPRGRRTFEEELSLFERQVTEEIRDRFGGFELPLAG
jgi:hypothetical protein